MESFVVWMMCDKCYRAYKSVDCLLMHKFNSHPPGSISVPMYFHVLGTHHRSRLSIPMNPHFSLNDMDQNRDDDDYYTHRLINYSSRRPFSTSSCSSSSGSVVSIPRSGSYSPLSFLHPSNIHGSDDEERGNIHAMDSDDGIVPTEDSNVFADTKEGVTDDPCFIKRSRGRPKGKIVPALQRSRSSSTSSSRRSSTVGSSSNDNDNDDCVEVNNAEYKATKVTTSPEAELTYSGSRFSSTKDKLWEQEVNKIIQEPNVTFRISSKEVVNAFDLLLKSSGRSNSKFSSPSSSTEKSSSEHQTHTGHENPNANNSSPTNSSTSFPCIQCHRNFESQAALNLHLKLHRAIHIKRKGKTPGIWCSNTQLEMPCEMCGRILNQAPYKCIDCPAATIKIEIPILKIKLEPEDVEIPHSSIESSSSPPSPKNQTVNPSKVSIRKGDEGGKETPSKSLPLSANRNEGTSKAAQEIPKTYERDDDREENEDDKLKKQFPFSCEICARCYAKEDRLRAHEKVHEKLKAYKCRDCDKYFNYKHQLRNHIRYGCS